MMMMMMMMGVAVVANHVSDAQPIP